MVCIDPAMCECVWLMIVAVCVGWVRSMGVGVYVCGCGCVCVYPGKWARGICFLL